ncbi:MAG: SDR family oxidoreductase [Deltaproteobacteria bacterium]|nr:SDR family oxidoreductase [Deltaproteobacteria bacterium]
MRLKDKTALITGAAGCIGFATAQRFAGEGAAVILSDINREACAERVNQIAAAGGTADMVIADLGKEAEVVAMFKALQKSHKRLDILVNIAGGDYEPMTGLEDVTDEGINRNIDANLKSCIFCCREASKMMMAQEYGKIINMASIMYRGTASPMQYTYSAAKGAVFSLTRGLAMNLGMFNINVNAIAPALIEVEALKRGMGIEMWDSVKEDCQSRYPIGRVGQPADVANLALFLASEESSFITGQVIELTGGIRL